MYQVRITEPAKQDIRSSFEWWRDNRSAEQADRWYRGVYKSITSLRQIPERCGQSPEAELLDGNMRQLLFGIGRRPTHRIVFSVSNKIVTILRVRHSSQIDFDSSVKPWRGSLQDASDANRKEATSFVDGFSASGGTNTLGALQKAFNYANIDTIVLLSDGAPDGENYDEIHQWLARANVSRNVTINCIAAGDYFKAKYGKFLRKIASDHHGKFIGR